MTLRRQKKSVNRRDRCDRPHGLTRHYGLVVHLGSAIYKYIWHSQWIGGVGGLEVGLWCQNYHGAVNGNGGRSYFLSRKSKVLRFRLRGDLAAMVINMPILTDLSGN